jgi:glycosyltransferase involved in cell wall biosynthesis
VTEEIAHRTTPRISVVVPSYNSGPYLRSALVSALTQDVPPHEVIVQDGGSTDGTVDVLRTFGDRVRWESVPDSGQSQALNRAIARATGDVILWLNADDLILPGAIRAATEAFLATPGADFVYGNYDMIRQDGRVMRHFTSSAYDHGRLFTHGCYIFSGAVFFRRRLLDRVGPFDETLQACMDLDYFLRLGDAHAVHLNRSVAQFRRSASAKSSRMRATFLHEAHRVRMAAAGQSRRRRLLGLVIDARDLILLSTEPVRHTSLWSAVRRQKVL